MTLGRIMDFAKSGDDARTLAMGPAGDTTCAVGSSVSAVTAHGDGTQSVEALINAAVQGTLQRLQSRGGVPGKPKVRVPCAIHDSVTHTTEECRMRLLESCPYCKSPVKRGELALHIPTCTAGKCHACNRHGHMRKDCHRERSKRYGSTPPATTAQQNATQQTQVKRPRTSVAAISADELPLEQPQLVTPPPPTED